MTPVFLPRSNDGVKGLRMCQRRRGAAMVASFGGQEIQDDDTAHKPLPLGPFLPGMDIKTVRQRGQNEKIE